MLELSTAPAWQTCALSTLTYGIRKETELQTFDITSITQHCGRRSSLRPRAVFAGGERVYLRERTAAQAVGSP